MTETTNTKAGTTMIQMDYAEWRSRNKALADELLEGDTTVDSDCPECGGEGTVECECSECGNEHEKECPACDGDGSIETKCNPENVERAMKIIYKEQCESDRILLAKWEGRYATV